MSHLVSAFVSAKGMYINLLPKGGEGRERDVLHKRTKG